MTPTIAALEADARAYQHLVQLRRRNVLITALVTVPIAAAILVIEYRLMLLAIIVLTPFLLAIVDAVRAARAAKDPGPCRLTWDDGGVVLQFVTEAVRVPFSAPGAHHVGAPEPSSMAMPPVGLLIVRAQPDALVLVEALSATKVRSFLVPSTPDEAEGFLDHLRRRGVAVQPEKQIAIAIVGFMIGALLSLGLGKVAAVLVAVGIAEIGLWAMHRAASPWPGVGFLAGALGLIVLKVFLTQSLVAFAAPHGTKTARRAR